MGLGFIQRTDFLEGEVRAGEAAKAWRSEVRGRGQVPASKWPDLLETILFSVRLSDAR